MIYWIVFLLSIFLSGIGLSINRKNKKLRFFFLTLSMIIPCVLAGMRGNYIGTDMQIYVLPIYKMATNSSSFSEFCQIVAIKLDITDILYLLVNYIAVKLPNSRFVLLVSLEALILVPVYIALLKERKNKYSVLLGQFILYTYLYNASYNMVRQSISIAFVTLALSFLNENKKKTFLIIVVIAALFHGTTFIVLLIYLLYLFYTTKRIPSSVKKLALLLVFVSISFGVMFSTKLISIFSVLGLLSQKRISSVNAWAREADFSFSNTFFYLIIYLIIYFNKKKINEHLVFEKMYRYVFAVGIIISQIGMFIAFADRLAYYFLYPVFFIVLPKLSIDNSRKISLKTIRTQVFILGLFTLYWIWWIGILNYHDTLPYVMFGE